MNKYTSEKSAPAKVEKGKGKSDAWQHKVITSTHHDASQKARQKGEKGP